MLTVDSRDEQSVRATFRPACNTCSNLGGALAQQGKLQQALPYLEKADQPKADFAAAKSNLAKVRAARQKRMKARQRRSAKTPAPSATS